MGWLWYWPDSGWDFDAWKKSHPWQPPLSGQAGKGEPVELVRPGIKLEDWQSQAKKWREVSDSILGKLTDQPPKKLEWEWLGEEFCRGARKDAPGFTFRRLRYRLTDDEWGYAWLLEPENAPARLPAIIALHQTNCVGKNEAIGLDDTPQTVPNGLRYGMDLVERGHIVLAPDAIAFGERAAGHGNAKYRSAEDFFTAHPEGSVMGKMAFDTSRAVDFLLQAPGVDASRIGCIGHSHGAYGTLFAMLADERINSGVISCGFNLLRKDTAPERWWRRTALMPRLGYFADQIAQAPIDFHIWLALLAPRPLAVIAGSRDTIFPNCSALPPAMEQVKQVYALHGAADAFQFDLFDGPHNFPQQFRKAAYELLERQRPALNR